MRMASRGPYSERACETIQLSYFFIKLKKKSIKIMFVLNTLQSMVTKNK